MNLPPAHFIKGGKFGGQYNADIVLALCNTPDKCLTQIMTVKVIMGQKAFKCKGAGTTGKLYVATVSNGVGFNGSGITVRNFKQGFIRGTCTVRTPGRY